MAKAEKVLGVCQASVVALEIKPQQGSYREEAEGGSGGSGHSGHVGRHSSKHSNGGKVEEAEGHCD